MGERRPIVIAGAGIGGLTAAVALAAKGLRPVVVERTAELSEIGAGIQIAPNAGRVLAALGLDAAVASLAIEPAAIDVVNGRTGRPLASVAGAAYRAAYGFPYRVIHRADLQRVLVEAAGRLRIRLELAATVEGFLPQGNALLVRLRKAGGVDVVSADALIGADGVWSALRDKIPGAAAPQPSGRTAWRAVIPADIARAIMPIDRVGLWLGARSHLVHYPVAQGAAVNVVAIVEERSDRKGWSAQGDPDELALKFRGWSGAARRILDAPVAWQKFAILTVDPNCPWQDDRLALLGDAAHAMTPFLAQGAAMAIEDGYVLAETLATDAEPAAALGAYVAARRPRVAAVAAASAATGRRFHMAGLMGLARDLALGWTGERLILRRNATIYGWRPGPRQDPSRDRPSV